MISFGIDLNDLFYIAASCCMIYYLVLFSSTPPRPDTAVAAFAISWEGILILGIVFNTFAWGAVVAIPWLCQHKPPPLWSRKLLAARRKKIDAVSAFN